MKYIRILCENNKFDVIAKSQGNKTNWVIVFQNSGGFHFSGKSACCSLKYEHLFQGRGRARKACSLARSIKT